MYVRVFIFMYLRKHIFQQSFSKKMTAHVAFKIKACTSTRTTKTKNLLTPFQPLPLSE